MNKVAIHKSLFFYKNRQNIKDVIKYNKKRSYDE